MLHATPGLLRAVHRAGVLRCLSSQVFPFHLAIPVHDLDAAKAFYGDILGCTEGRSSTKWQDYNLYGSQLVVHWAGSDYKVRHASVEGRRLCTDRSAQGRDHFNPVDGDEVPVPHFGVCLGVPEFHALSERLRSAGVKFIIEPHLRFEGAPGEQYTMFFKDPSNNSLEFKAMTNPGNLFAKYFVSDDHHKQSRA
jgi:uncharacterized protein